MDMKSNQSSPVIADTTIRKSRYGISSDLIPCTSTTSAYTLSRKSGFNRKKHRISMPDDVLRNGFVDAMKASSPPRKSPRKLESPENDGSYDSWMATYPSAISSFELIAKNAKDKRLVLFLDYDGTLSPIVDDPDNAIMSDAMRSVIREAAIHFPTAIISGRRRDQVYEFVGLTELHYAGSHGMDIMIPSKSCERDAFRFKGNEVNLFQPAKEFIPMIEEVYAKLIERTKGIDGVKVENNKFCVSVHYRRVNVEDWEVVALRVQKTVQEYPRLKLTHGRKVLEVRPLIKWDKGKAVEFLMESLELVNCRDVLPIYIGDDRTDEDAFRVLRDKVGGYGILVSSVPKETAASFTLKDPKEVMTFLQRLIMWKNIDNL